MNRTTNATLDYYYHKFCGDRTFFLPSYNAWHFVIVLIVTLGFIGNIVTVVVISCWRKLHCPTFTMIACLAVSDAYSLLVSMMHVLTNHVILIVCYDFKAIVSRSSVPVITLTVGAFSGLARHNGGMQLCVLACLRFTAIVYPYKYEAYCTCKAVIVVSVVTSVIILISSAVEMILYDVFENNCAVSMPMYAMNFIVPTSLFISLHCLKLRALRRSPALDRMSPLKMNVVLLILMSVYVISSASMLLSRILSCLMVFKEFYRHFKYITATSFSLNCAVNPFVYFFSSPPVAQWFRKMWHRLCNRYQVTDNGNAQEIEMNNIPTAWG